MSDRRPRSAFPIGLALAATLGAGCSDGGVTRVNDPYGGTPFPSRRTPFGEVTELGIVSNNGSDSLTLVDLAVPEVVGTAKVGLDPVDLDGPHHVAFDRERGEVFTALAYPVPPTAPGPHAAHGSSQRPGYVERLSLGDFAPLGALEVETNPGDVVLSDDGGLLVVSHFDLVRAVTSGSLEEQRATLALIDPRRIGAGGTPELVTTCVAPHGVALSRPSGDRAYVACYGEDALAVVDTTDPSARPELVSLGVGGEPGRPFYGPYAAVLSPDGSLVAVSNTERRDVRLFDVEAGAFLDLALDMGGAAPYFPAWTSDGSELFVPVQGPDGVLHVATDGDVRKARLFASGECEKPHEVVRTPGDRLFVVCEGDHVAPGTLLELDPASLATLVELEMGVYPDRLALGTSQ